MYCRDFRHQIEPNEQQLTAKLEQARERFFTNLSMLQLQLPELAQRLRELKPTTYTLAIDRAGAGNCIDSNNFRMHWPPPAFMRSYTLPSELAADELAIVAVDLEDSAARLVPFLAAQNVPYVLLYVPSLELFHASLHFTDWLPVLHSKTLFVQLAPPTEQRQLKQDLDTLASHGIPTTPHWVITAQPEISNAEHAWHFEQSLYYQHDCDPVLRCHSHKYKWQPEFRLQNALIETARQRPMRLPSEPWTLILCGTQAAVYTAAAQLPHLQRVILIDSQPIPAPLLDLFIQRSIQVHECIGSVKATASLFVQLLSQLPVETPWFCRLYQAGTSPEAQQLRQRLELELRFRVQPAMGVRRSLVAAVQASAVPQNMLTRRTTWPQLQGQKQPVLLLGNGPSLNATITAIQQGHAKGYLLVSCGTTLLTLYRHNITPHVHLELELATHIFSDIDRSYLAHIHFIAPLGFQHQWRERFGSHSSFISDSYPVDSLVPGLPDDTIRVTDGFPTVLNLGLSLAGRLGAEQLWLAGFDLAFSNLDNHHAQGSVYAQMETQRYVLSSGELISATAIDGRAVFTKREFQLAAFQAQDILQHYPNMTAYQLCNGLDLGAELRTSLPPLANAADQRQPKVALTNTCTPVVVDWQKLPHACKAAPYLALFLPDQMPPPTAEQYRNILKQPFILRSQAHRKRAPAELWTEHLKRNLAALLLRLEITSLAELPAAEELFMAMLADLAQHEANIL